jgi:cadmium resistance protein CadD (predicted permease)
MLNLLMISVVAYAATNVDNLTVLLNFLAASRGHTRVVMAGHIGGSLALIIFALACAVLMLSLPRPWIGVLGVFPLGIGLNKLFKRWFAGEVDGSTASEHPDHRPISAWMVAMVAISNGSDNIAVYTSLYAGRPVSSDLVITLTLVAMIGVGCFVANCLVSHPFVGLRIKHYGEVILPWVLIVIGISVLQQSGTLQYIGL